MSPDLQSTAKRMKKKKRHLKDGEPSNEKKRRKTSPEHNETEKNKKMKKHKFQKHHGDEDESIRSDKERSTKQRGGEKKHVTDPRFASVHSDPRFQRMPRRETKVAIDSRFADAFKDKRFALSTAPVDKRGKERKGKRQNPLLRYYVRDEEITAEGIREKDGVGGAGDDGLSDGPRRSGFEAENDVERDVKEFGTRATSSDSSSSSSDEDDEEEDDDEYSVNSDVAHYLMGNHDDTPLTDQATRRLAVVNMDWDHIKAIDIYVIMRSCLPRNGDISSVAIYPSELGLKCMEIEATRGPSALINGNLEDDYDMEDSDSDVDIEKENEKLRTYELNRLRYYYAVVECDSSITANYLYETLDGTELLKTSNVFDLRFIPESMEFTRPARDIATEAPANYKEPDFETRALQHSNVKLSWEEDEPKRKKILRRKFNADQLDDLELKEFLASEDEDSDTEEERENLQDGEGCKNRTGEKYLALLQSGDGSDAESGDEQDVEITFNTGLEDIAKRALEKKDRKSESVWEAYLRKRKEKKKARKKNAKYSSDEDGESGADYQEEPNGLGQHDDFFEEEFSDADVEVEKGKKRNASSMKIKGRGGKKVNKGSESEKEKEASQAELELLCANTGRENSPSRDEETRSGKVKKGKKLPAENKLPKEDYQDDPRFSALFTSHLYALDPTDPQFKRSATYARQVIQKQKQNGQDEPMKVPPEKTRSPLVKCTTHDEGQAIQPDDVSSGKEKAEFLSVVRSLKRRTEALRSEKKGK